MDRSRRSRWTETRNRGCARTELIRELRRAAELFIIRGRGNVTVTHGGRARLLSQFAADLPLGIAVRLTHVLYQQTQRQLVDLVGYRDPAFQEPWVLILPPDSEAARMQIERGHRDWKTHLWVRGLHSRCVTPSEWLACYWPSRSPTRSSSSSAPANWARRCATLDRDSASPAPAGHTTRTLGILTLGCAMLATPRHAPSAWTKLLQLLAALQTGAGIVSFRLAAQPS